VSEPVRTCVGCRVAAPQSELVRLTWDGTSVAVSRTAPGRGAWVHPRTECLGKLSRKGILTRAFRENVPVDAISGLSSSV